MAKNVVVDATLKMPSSAAVGGTLTILEPSVSIHGGEILYTANLFMARSVDRGKKWSGFDPGKYLVPGPPTPFCCDQSLLYVPEHDLYVWLLQYDESKHDNTLRVAVKHGTAIDVDDWMWWDLHPVDVDPAWKDTWFDYNHLARTDEHLFIGSNVFRIDDDQHLFRSTVLRVKFSDLLAAMQTSSPLTFDSFAVKDASTLRCALGATDTMYIGGQTGTSTVRVFAWPDGSSSVTFHDVAVSPWNDGSSTPYSAPGPDKNDWMSRLDDRITAAWIANDKVGFMWSANRLALKRPWPYVRVVIIDAETFAVSSEPDIFSNDFAYAWPDACPNPEGVVGVTLFRGGGKKYPGHVVGVLDAGTWRLKATVDGTSGPDDGKWGDYLTIRRRTSPDDAKWIASGYTLQGGGSVSDVEPIAVLFSVK